MYFKTDKKTPRCLKENEVTCLCAECQSKLNGINVFIYKAQLGKRLIVQSKFFI